MIKNKVTTYLLYAIGEIMLVVIGILIAVEIDNWNEDRQKKELRDNYYHSMISSFKKDLKEFDNFLSFVEKSKNEIDSFKLNIANARSFEEASQYVDQVNYLTADCDLNKSIWESLINTGDVDLLDESVKSALTNFWNEYNDYYESDYANKQHYYDLLKDYVTSSEHGINGVAIDLLKDNQPLIEAIKSKQDYLKEVNTTIFILKFREIGNRQSLWRMKQFKQEINDMISQMQSELE